MKNNQQFDNDIKKSAEQIYNSRDIKRLVFKRIVVSGVTKVINVL